MLLNALLAALAIASVAHAAPAGGVGLNRTADYVPLSDFDFQSLNLALQQEWLELSLFRAGINAFAPLNYSDAGLTTDDQALLQFMADQEVGHAQLLTNILGPNASQPCNYSFPFSNVSEFVDLSRKVTRVGESGVFGFLQHLDSRAAGDILGQAIATESRQQMVFRQFEGLFPMTFWFIPAITQSMAWTLQAPFLTECPSTNPRVGWQIFPGLNVTSNATSATTFANGTAGRPAISTVRPSLSETNQTLNLTWESPGLQVGPNSTYNTSSAAGEPMFAAWISQLNITYSPLTNVSNNTALTTQPGGATIFQDVRNDTDFPVINGTIFLLVTDADLFVTPYNLSQIEPHIVAGPALYTVD
ncbi:unnamed protein product [Somion occarium]|uniref:Rds1 protein n=1 Tax=Somion occarium TaxID=3059160 RepID=A0ABP1DH99_9APHY